MTFSAWRVVLGAAILSPLVTCLPMLAAMLPGLGLPPYPPAQGIDLWHAHVLWLVSFLVLGLVIAGQQVLPFGRDRWLAVAVIVVGALVFFRGARLDPTHSIWFALGALLIVAVRACPSFYHPRIISVLVALGVFQALYIIHQALGFDLLWGRVAWDNGPPMRLLGTLGTVDAASAYVAILTPLFPVWAIPLGVVAVVMGKSAGGMLALALALVVKYRHARVGRSGLALIATGAFGLAAWWASHNAHTLPFNKLAQSIFARAAMWDFGLTAWWHTASPLTGWGLSGWRDVVPRAQIKYGFSPTGELWAEAHNEYLQWLTEAGLIGMLLLGLWLWDHRAMFTRDPWAASLAALSVESFTFFPWHVVSVALIGILVIGCATANDYTTEPALGG